MGGTAHSAAGDGAGMDDPAGAELTVLLRAHAERPESVVAAGLLAAPERLGGRFVRGRPHALEAAASSLAPDESLASVA